MIINKYLYTNMYVSINVHIQICNVTDLYFHNSRSSCYLVLDLKCGGDIRYYLRKKLIFEEKDVAFYVSCIGSALEFIHSMNVLHRYSCMHIWNMCFYIHNTYKYFMFTCLICFGMSWIFYICFT